MVVELGQNQLVFAGRRLDPNHTVDDYNLLDGTRIHMLAATGANADAQAERQRRAQIEVVNAQLHEEIDRVRAQAELAQRQLLEAEQRVAQLERTLGSARVEQAQAAGGQTTRRLLPREGVPPTATIPAGAKFQVHNAGDARVNGFYKENGASSSCVPCTPLNCEHLGLIVAVCA